MNRRDFIKKGVLAAGALSVASATGLSALASTSVNDHKDGHDSGKNLKPSVSNPQKPDGTPLPADSERTFLKSIMWGVIGMQGSSVLEKCRAVKAVGFDGIEPYSHENRAEMLAAMQETGLRASSVCNAKHWSFPLSSPDKSIRQQGIDALYTAMEDAKTYGTDTVLLVPGIVNAEVSYDACWERSTACLSEVLPVAEKEGITIGIENVWNYFLTSPLEMARYIDQFDSKAVGAYFDVGNIMLSGWPEQWINILGGRIARIHLKEFSRKLADEQGLRKGFQVPLGDGEVDWPRVMEAIRKQYRSQWLTIEHQGGETPEGLADLAQRWERINRAIPR